ncbi:MAG: B12-binding domain-containing protein [Methanomassiliicoccales archaeon]
MLDLSDIDFEPIFKRYDILVEAKEKPEDIAAKILPKDPLLKKVAEDVVQMRYKDIEADTKAALTKFSPEEVVEKGLLKGMEVISELYGRGIYYLPQVMVAADAFDIGLKFAERTMKGQFLGKGKVVMHVAEGDPHDIGKNIAVVLFRSNGFQVIDMGRDVPVDDVVKTVVRVDANVLTGTALMTATMSAFPKIARRLVEKGIEIPFICAGGAVNRSYIESFPLGIYAEKAAQGLVLANKAIDGWDWKKIRQNWDDLKNGRA